MEQKMMPCPVEITDYAAVCKELGCVPKPGVALRFIQDLRKQLANAHERQDWLLRSWDDATITERQELDRLRRGWGPTTPTERMRRMTDVAAAMHCLSSAMADLTLSEEEAESVDEEVHRRLDEAYQHVSKQYEATIAILNSINDPLHLPDLESGGDGAYERGVNDMREACIERVQNAPARSGTTGPYGAISLMRDDLEQAIRALPSPTTISTGSAK